MVSIGVDDIDCFWYPELKGCETPDDDGGNGDNGDNNNGGGDGQGNAGGDGGISETAKARLMDELAGPVDPMTGQAMMLVTALVHTVVPLVQQFRWRSQALGGSGSGDFYQVWADNSAELGTTNIWKISDQFNAYGSALIWGTVFIAQILISSGLEPTLGETIFYTAAGTLGTVHSVIYLAMLGYSMFQAYSLDKLGGATTQQQADAATIIAYIQNDFATYSGAAAFSGALLMNTRRDWEAATEAAKAKAASSTEEAEVVEEEGANLIAF